MLAQAAARRWPAWVVGLALLPALAQAEPIGPGVVAPEAAGIVLNGPADSKVSQLRGRVLVVEFWASWCGPCVQAMPRLDALRRELHAAGHAASFEVLAVGVDTEVDVARRFLQRYPVSYPVVVDPLGIASRNYGVWRLPATFLVDRHARIVQIYHGYGPQYADDLRARILALLSRDPVRIAAQTPEAAGNP